MPQRATTHSRKYTTTPSRFCPTQTTTWSPPTVCACTTTWTATSTTMKRRADASVLGEAIRLLFLLLFLCGGSSSARPVATSPAPGKETSSAPKPTDRQDDSFNSKPARDLALRPEGVRKGDALAHYIEGMAAEENGEIAKALKAYRQVLNVDPGQAELACRVASLLTRQDDFPTAIDVLKDAVKATPRAPEPYLQLAFVYAKY